MVGPCETQGVDFTFDCFCVLPPVYFSSKVGWVGQKSKPINVLDDPHIR